MNNLILSQLYSLFINVFSGIIIGYLFDIFRVLRKTFKTSDFATYIEDIFFWFLTGIILVYILFYICNGEIRLYNIFGLILRNN